MITLPPLPFDPKTITTRRMITKREDLKAHHNIGQCIYCGISFEGLTSNINGQPATNKDHLFNRKMLNIENKSYMGLNYKLKTCFPCNSNKSVLEQPFSALCMLPGPMLSQSRSNANFSQFLRQSRSASINGQSIWNSLSLSDSLEHLGQNWNGGNFIRLKGVALNDFTPLVIQHIQGLFTVQKGIYLDPSHIKIAGFQNINLLKGVEVFTHPFETFGSAMISFNIGNDAIISHWWHSTCGQGSWVTLVYQANTMVSAIIRLDEVWSP